MNFIVYETHGPNRECAHLCHLPKFSAADCRWLTPEQVRQKFPCFDNECCLCHQRVKLYASKEHYDLGDFAHAPPPPPNDAWE
jgi:formate-dependent nitrite reductase cytochrome c552 subunit